MRARTRFARFGFAGLALGLSLALGGCESFDITSMFPDGKKKLPGERRLLRIFGVEQRQTEVVVTLAISAVGVFELHVDEPRLCAGVALPERQGLFVREQRPREIAVVVGRAGFFEFFRGPGRQRDAFGVRLVVADRFLKDAHRGIALGRIGGHRPRLCRLCRACCRALSRDQWD